MKSALKIAAGIDAGDLTAEAALRDCIEAIETREHELHVFTHRPQDVSANNTGPLRGIAIGVKDIFDTHDMPSAYGSPIYKDHQPAADAPLVAMARTAGAIITGKTVTTEFAWFEPGPTRNPHNLDHTPGGSSSGSAAGVAAGFFPAAFGSQTGGSIIRPAAFCGIAGFKPSFRLLPTVGMKCFSWSLDTAGTFGACVADVAFITTAVSGRDLRVDQIAPAAPRIGLYAGSIDDTAEDVMIEAWWRTARLAERAGASILNITGPKDIEAARDAHAPIQDFEANLALASEQIRHAGKLSERLRKHLATAKTIVPETYDDARRIANRARKQAHALFENVDVLLLPSAPGAAPKTCASTGDSIFNRLWTLLGLPCVNVPGNMRSDGLPLGLQVIAPFGRDHRALRAASWLESVIVRAG